MTSTILGGAYIQRVTVRIPELSSLSNIEFIEVEDWYPTDMTFPDPYALKIKVEVPLAFLRVTVLHSVNCCETIRFKVMDGEEQANSWDLSRALANPDWEPTKQYWLKSVN